MAAQRLLPDDRLDPLGQAGRSRSAYRPPRPPSQIRALCARSSARRLGSARQTCASNASTTARKCAASKPGSTNTPPPPLQPDLNRAARRHRSVATSGCATAPTTCNSRTAAPRPHATASSRRKLRLGQAPLAAERRHAQPAARLLRHQLFPLRPCLTPALLHTHTVRHRSPPISRWGSCSAHS